MTKEKAKELSEILKAYSKGKIIQFKVFEKWSDIDFNKEYLNKYASDGCILRIKPEPKLIPFTFEDAKLFKDKWIKLKGKTWLKRIVIITTNNVVIFAVDKYDQLDFIHISYEKLLSDYEFEDRSPCGKYIEE